MTVQIRSDGIFPVKKKDRCKRCALSKTWLRPSVRMVDIDMPKLHAVDFEGSKTLCGIFLYES